MLDPWYTHNIVVQPDAAQVFLVDTSRCHSFYSRKLGPSLARWWFQLMRGKDRWIRRLESYRDALIGRPEAEHMRAKLHNMRLRRLLGRAN